MTHALSHRPSRIALVNPNTDAHTTAAMVEIACAAAPGVAIDGVTAAFGASLIDTPQALATGAEAVVVACRVLASQAFAGVIVAAFGDPGLDEARALLPVPVVGIAEASMAAAARCGRFSVVTTTPALEDSIRGLAASYGHAQALASVRLTNGPPSELVNDPDRLRAALLEACRTAITRDRVDALVIGGGPLASAARTLQATLAVPVIEPIPCAVARLTAIATWPG